MKIKILSKEQIEQKYGSTIDTTPTQNSTNLVTSGGVYSAIPSTSDFVTKTGSQSISNKTITSSTYNGYTLGSQCQKSYTTSVTSGSSDLVTSGAVYTQIGNVGGMSILSSEPTWSDYLDSSISSTLTIKKDFRVVYRLKPTVTTSNTPVIIGSIDFKKGEKMYREVVQSSKYGCGKTQCIGVHQSSSSNLAYPVYVFVGTYGSSTPSLANTGNLNVRFGDGGASQIFSSSSPGSASFSGSGHSADNIYYVMS